MLLVNDPPSMLVPKTKQRDTNSIFYYYLYSVNVPNHLLIYNTAQQQSFDTLLGSLIFLIVRPSYRKQIITSVFILGCIYALPSIYGYVSVLQPSSYPYMLDGQKYSF